MKIAKVLAIVTILLAICIATSPTQTAVAQANPVIKLTPTFGFSAITIEGTGFSTWTGIKILWDGSEIPAIVDLSQKDETTFTAIISVPTQTSPGFHKVTAVDGYGAEASEMFDVIDMTGPRGPTGPEGPPGEATVIEGEPGISCWDLNENHIPDPEEDTNGDGTINVLDCQGPPGESGESQGTTIVEGPPGPSGINCWDLNENGLPDDREDINRDGEVNVLDCRGPQGEPGHPGADGLTINWRGEWSPETRYAINDAVSYDGSSYLAIASSTGQNPAESHDSWAMLAARGEQGEAGGGGNVGTTGFFLGLIALILIAAGKIKKWIIP